MTTQELERQFQQALSAAVALAQASGQKGDVIGYNLRSLASDVGRKWNAELNRRNAERIEGLRGTADKECDMGVDVYLRSVMTEEAELAILDRAFSRHQTAKDFELASQEAYDALSIH